MMEYSVIYTKRRTVGIGVKCGRVIVRAPFGMSTSRIEHLLEKHVGWISRQIEKSKEMTDIFDGMTDSEIADLKRSAKEYFGVKTREISNIMGLKPGRITITSARKRYGSCSSSGNICFSYRLMLYPEAAREYVIVHELAHLKEMNHSCKFYAIIEKYLPDYKERKKLLK